MTVKRAFSLVEVLFAAALLGLVVAACVPMLSSREPAILDRPDPTLRDLARADRVLSPPGVNATTTPSFVGQEVEGEWIVLSGPSGYAVVWRPTDSAIAAVDGQP